MTDGTNWKSPMTYGDLLSTIQPPTYQELRRNHGAATSSFVKPLKIHFPKGKKHIDLDLGFVRSFRIKPVGDKSEVLDLLAFTSDSIRVCLDHQTRGVRYLKVVDLHGNVESSVRNEGSVKKMALLDEGRSIAQTDGWNVVIKQRELDGTTPRSPVGYKSQTAVQAIASVNQKTLAIALEKKVTLLTSEGQVSTTYDRTCGTRFWGAWSWTYPVIDMCGLTDDKLLVFDPCGIHQINPCNGHSDLIKVPKMKDVTSVAAYDDNFLFACDPNNKLFLFGLDSRKKVKVWCLQEFLKQDDTLQHVSVFRKNTCVCSTKFGFVCVFTITLKNSSA